MLWEWSKLMGNVQYLELQVLKQAHMSDYDYFSNDPLNRPTSTKIKCPYIPKHKVQPRNFASHVKKCALKLSPKFLSKFANCKYNSLHILSVYEIGVHEMTCPNRETILSLEDRLLEQDRVLCEEVSVGTSSQASGRGSVGTGKGKGKGRKKEAVGYQDQTEYEDEEGIVHKEWQLREKILLAREEEKDCDRFSRLDRKLWENDKPAQEQEQDQVDGPLKFQELASIATSQSSKNPSSKKYSLHLDPQPQPQPEPQPENPTKQESGQKLLHECQQCRKILADGAGKLWKNKKLLMYLKKYNRLESQLQRMREYRANVESLINEFGGGSERKRNEKGFSPEPIKPIETVPIKKQVRSQILMDTSLILDKPLQQPTCKESPAVITSKTVLKLATLTMNPNKEKKKQKNSLINLND